MITTIILAFIFFALCDIINKQDKQIQVLNTSLNRTIGVLVKKDLKIQQLENGIKARNMVLMGEAIEDLLENEDYEEAHKLSKIQIDLIHEL